MDNIVINLSNEEIPASVCLVPLFSEVAAQIGLKLYLDLFNLKAQRSKQNGVCGMPN